MKTQNDEILFEKIYRQRRPYGAVKRKPDGKARRDRVIRRMAKTAGHP